MACTADLNSKNVFCACLLHGRAGLRRRTRRRFEPSEQLSCIGSTTHVRFATFFPFFVEVDPDVRIDPRESGHSARDSTTPVFIIFSSKQVMGWIAVRLSGEGSVPERIGFCSSIPPLPSAIANDISVPESHKQAHELVVELKLGSEHVRPYEGRAVTRHAGLCGLALSSRNLLALAKC